MDPRNLRHAYAVLGLTPPITERDLKRRHWELVARWRPDRFQSDPEGQAEAAIMLRNINIHLGDMALWMVILVGNGTCDPGRLIVWMVMGIRGLNLDVTARWCLT